ncbi:MAG TPA: hypothetical protein DCZ01_08575 [Elusimicrobia bacterium]|nr:MAG: hypothetical protein A2X37_05035 [Elusimicrobia bacterium GWA2_66_18]HAZ08557.1 hypothetical protein [Elusimicrobiota bacterium]
MALSSGPRLDVFVEAARILSSVCWIVWIPSSAVVIARASRRMFSRLSHAQRVTLVLAPVPVLALARWLPMHVSIDPVFLCHWLEPWKGMSGRVLVDLLASWTASPEFTSIWIARGFYLAVPFLALAVLGLEEEPSPVGRGGVFILALLLLGNPIMVVGSMSVRYFFFVPAAIAVILVSGREWLAKGGNAPFCALASSLILLGWSRPEIAPVAVLLTGLLAWQAWRAPRLMDRREMGGLLATGLALLAVFPAELGYLVAQSRIDSISLKGNILGQRPVWMLLPLLAENALRNIPSILEEQTLMTGGLLLLAAARMAQLARRPVAENPEQWWSAAILVSYLMIGAPHCEGLGAGGGVAKYGLVINLPVWHLAAAFLKGQVGRGRRRLAILTAAGSLVLSTQGIASYFGEDSERREENASRDQLYWEAIPAFARHSCPRGEPPACVVVGAVGDPRSERPFSPLIEDKTVVGMLLSSHGCRVPKIAGAGPDSEPAPSDDLADLLCGRRAACGPTGAVFPADRAVIVHHGPQDAGLLDRFLERQENCGWRRSESWAYATTLERRGADSASRRGKP